jgi:hypothetical protein
MSTKSSIFLTKDNEHCYFESSDPLIENGKWAGDTIYLEFDKKNAQIVIEDETDIIIKIKPKTEIHSIFSDLGKGPLYEVQKLLKDLILWEQTNHIDSELLERINKASEKLNPYW